MIYVVKKEYDKAKEMFSKIRPESPVYPSAIFNLSCVYSLEKNKEQALAYLEKAVKLDPKYQQKAKTDPEFEWLRDEL